MTKALTAVWPESPYRRTAELLAIQPQVLQPLAPVVSSPSVRAAPTSSVVSLASRRSGDTPSPTWVFIPHPTTSTHSLLERSASHRSRTQMADSTSSFVNSHAARADVLSTLGRISDAH